MSNSSRVSFKFEIMLVIEIPVSSLPNAKFSDVIFLHLETKATMCLSSGCIPGPSRPNFSTFCEMLFTNISTEFFDSLHTEKSTYLSLTHLVTISIISLVKMSQEVP